MNQPVRIRPQRAPHAPRFTIEQFYRIADAGALDEFSRTELLDGRISVTRQQWLPHARAKMPIYDAQRGAPDGSVKLVVEVADSSERHDLGRKRRIYAAHGIPEYWVAVLRTRRFERFADADGKDYVRHDGVGFDEGIASLTLPGVAVPPGALGG